MLGLRAPGAEGGVEHAVAELCPRLAALGWELTVFCRPRYRTGPSPWPGVRFVDVPTLYTKHLEALLHTTLAVQRVLAGFDLVHFHATGPSTLSVVPRAFGVPTVATIHGLDWQRDKWGPQARTLLRACAWAAGRFPDQVITVSEFLAEHYRSKGREEVTAIPNGVTPNARRPLSDARVEGLRPGYVLYLGRIVPEKGLDTLVRAFVRSGSQRQLVITGGATYTEGHLAHLRRLADDRVLFTGPRFGEAKDALLTHAGALALPSRLEGFPLSLLEGMAAGLPVLASDIAPHREILPGDAYGLRVPVDDVEAWTRALDTLDSDPDELRAIRGRNRVLVEYGWDGVARRTSDVYERLLGEQRVDAGLATARRTGLP